MSKLSLASLVAIVMVSIAPTAWADSPPDYVGEFGGFACCGLAALDGKFFGPMGVAVAPAGTVYVADSINDRVEYFTLSGVYLGKWGGLDNPHGIAVATDGTIYVADTNNNRIVQFSSTGTQLDAFGTLGTGPGEFDLPVGVAVDAQGEIYVADNGNDRIQRFRPDHTFRLEWGGTGTAEGELDCPAGVTVWGNYVYVADACNSRIQRFSTSGFFQRAWGSFGSGNSQFISPKGLAVDLNGAVYVADSGNDRIQKFNRDGLYLGQWTATSLGNTFERPSAVAATSGVGFTIYVVDAETHLAYRFTYPVTGVPGDGGDAPAPARIRVFPNPATARAQISFPVLGASAGAGGAQVLAEVFDIAGRSVQTLHDGFLPEGERMLVWDGRDHHGRASGSGVYFVRVIADGHPAGVARFVLAR